MVFVYHHNHRISNRTCNNGNHRPSSQLKIYPFFSDKIMSEEAGIFDLPMELLLNIFLRLSRKDLVQLEMSSTIFRNIIISHHVYRTLYMRLPNYMVYNNHVNRTTDSETQTHFSLETAQDTSKY